MRTSTNTFNTLTLSTLRNMLAYKKINNESLYNPFSTLYCLLFQDCCMSVLAHIFMTLDVQILNSQVYTYSLSYFAHIN